MENRREHIKGMLQQIILSDDELKSFMYEAFSRVDVYPDRDLEITWKHSDLLKGMQKDKCEGN